MIDDDVLKQKLKRLNAMINIESDMPNVDRLRLTKLVQTMVTVSEILEEEVTEKLNNSGLIRLKDI